MLRDELARNGLDDGDRFAVGDAHLDGLSRTAGGYGLAIDEHEHGAIDVGGDGDAYGRLTREKQSENHGSPLDRG